MKMITCVYSPAKKRGPPRKRATGESRDSEGREEERKQRRKEDCPRRVPEEVSSVPNPNLGSASVLNILGALLNPATAASTMRPIPPPPPPTIDQAALQQILLSTLGTANTGYHNLMNNAPNAASQLYLQQLQQQMQLQQLQQNLQQQLQQQPTTTQQGHTTRGAESSLSSSSPEEENKTQALQNEVERLRQRVDELETENADLKQKLDALLPSKKNR